MINQMSSSMRNFMEAYSAVHNKEAKEEFYSHKDEISEMDFSLINQTELNDIAEEVLEELFEEGYSVEQCEAIFEEVLTEARVTYGSDTESPRAKKMSAVKSSLKEAMGKVKEKAANGAVKSYGAYRSAKQFAADKANRLKQGTSNASAQTVREAKDAKAGIKSGIKGMIGEAAKKVGDAANKVSSRMSEGTIRKDVGDLYRAIYEKKAEKDYDGDGEVESGKDEYFGSRDKAIKKAMGKKGKCEKCGKDPCECEGMNEEFEHLDEMGKSDQGVRDRIAMFKNSKIEYTPPTNWDKDANRGKGATVSPKQAEKRRRKSLRQEELEATGLFTAKEIEALVESENVDEAMSSYDRNRKRAAQRAADRNAARAAGKTGVVPGVGYVTPRREKETYTDEKGTVRHKSGAKNEELEHLDEISKKLARSYVDKATADRDKNAKDWKSTGSGEAFNKAEDREKNIQRASSKLYKGTPAGKIMGTKNPAKVSATGKDPAEPKEKSKGIKGLVKKLTRKEELESLHQAYLSMSNGGEQLDEISQKTATNAYTARRRAGVEGNDTEENSDKGDKTREYIKRKFGDKAAKNADQAATAGTFGRGTPSAKERIEKNRDYRTTKAGKMHGQDQKKLKSDLKKNKTQKEQVDSLHQAYLSMMSEGEQLDEISKKLARNYLNKSMDDYDKTDKYVYTKGRKHGDAMKGMDRLEKREKGGMRAQGKLYKGTPNEGPEDKNTKVPATGEDPARVKPKEKSKGIKGLVKRLTRKEEVTFSEAELKAIQAKVDAWDLDEAQMARNNPEKYEKDSRKSETSGQKSERNVRNRLKTMDPDKAEAMKKQMRAVGLNV